VVSSTPRPHFTLGKNPVPILQESVWAPGPVRTGGKSRPHRDSIPDRPARSQSLYRLSYRARTHTHTHTHTYIFIYTYMQRTPTCFGKPYDHLQGKYERFIHIFYVLLTVHPCIIFFKQSQIGAQYFLVYLFQLLYIFRATMCKLPVRKADNLTTILCRCHEIWEP